MSYSALVLKSQSEFEIVRFPKATLGKRDGLLKVRAAGICGTDRHLFEGTALLPYPVILGHEILGQIIELAPTHSLKSFSSLKEGMRVVLVPGRPCGQCPTCLKAPHFEHLCDNRCTYGFSMSCNGAPFLLGGFAEAVALLSGFWLIPVPDDISDDTGSLLEVIAVALRAFQRALAPGLPHFQLGIGLDTTVVIIGCGPLGLCMAAVARTHGCRVVLLEVLANRIQLAQAVDLAPVIDASRDMQGEIKTELTHILGTPVADLVIECAGEPRAFVDAIHLVRRGGKIVEMGHFLPNGFANIDPYLICRNDIEVIGSLLAPPQLYPTAITIVRRYHEQLTRVVTHRFRLEQFQEAVDAAIHRKGLKVVFAPH